MQAQLGTDYPAFLATFEQNPPVSIRINPQKITGNPLDAGLPVPWHPQGYYLEERPSFVADPLFHGGAYYVQEASSMMLYQFLDSEKPLKVLDLSAAPGGKSTLLLSALHPESMLVANEVIRQRAGVLAENITRWGAPNCVVTQQDPIHFQKLGAYFDLILVDAPCSGEGMFRKDPNSRLEWSESHVEHCSARQQRILSDILPCLKAGGSLIYSTCTYAPEENQRNISRMLDAFPELEPDPLSDLSPYGAVAVQIAGEPYGAWQMYPHKLSGEGLFISRLTKKAGDNEKKQEKSRPQKVQAPGKMLQTFMDTYLNPHPSEKYTTYLHHDTCLLIPLSARDLVDAKLHILQAGLNLGKMRRDEISPSHDLSLSYSLRQNTPTIDLSLPQALEYLQRKDLRLASPPPNGLYTVSHQHVRLGWVKSINGLLKNQFPMNWRIRKELGEE